MMKGRLEPEDEPPPHCSGSYGVARCRMKTARLKMTGVALLFLAPFVAVCLQVFGLGVVTTHPSTTPPREVTTPDGKPATVRMGPTTVVHLTRIVPLAAVAIAGLVCVSLAKRNERQVG